MDKFLETYNTPRMNHEEIKNVNRPIMSKENESFIKNLPTQEKPRRPDDFLGKFYQTYKVELMPILLKLFKKLKKEHSQTHLTRPVLP